MVAVITSISPAGHGIFKQISIPSHDPVQNSRFRGLSGMAKPLKKRALQGSHPPNLRAAVVGMQDRVTDPVIRDGVDAQVERPSGGFDPVDDVLPARITWSEKRSHFPGPRRCHGRELHRGDRAKHIFEPANHLDRRGISDRLPGEVERGVPDRAALGYVRTPPSGG